MQQQKYNSTLRFTCREDRMAYVYDKYSPLLQHSVLDVGADNCLLANYLPTGCEYKGIGLGGKSEKLIQFNLEQAPFPFVDQRFETVVCLDVLEHLENIHEVIDEIFRVAAKNVIISLPNPIASLFGYFKKGCYSKDKQMKFYGIAPTPELDRHKWFYTPEEAGLFVQARAAANNFEVVQFDQRGLPNMKKTKNVVKEIILKKLIGPNLSLDEIFGGTMWWALERRS